MNDRKPFGPFRYMDLAGAIVGPDRFSETVGEKPGRQLIVASIPTPIASFSLIDDDDRIACGHLLAAAPEMLAALKNADRALVAAYGEPMVGVSLQNLFGADTILVVRAAIAKAEGRADG